MQPEIKKYFENAPEAQRKALMALRTVILEAIPKADETLKWGRPVYSLAKDVVYLTYTKSYSTIGFFHADVLPDPDRKLEGTGKSMRHVKVKDVAGIDRKRLTRWIKLSAKD